MVIASPSGQAGNDNNGSQDEKQMIQIGLSTAPVPLSDRLKRFEPALARVLMPNRRSSARCYHLG